MRSRQESWQKGDGTRHCWEISCKPAHRGEEAAATLWSQGCRWC